MADQIGLEERGQDGIKYVLLKVVWWGSVDTEIYWIDKSDWQIKKMERFHDKKIKWWSFIRDIKVNEQLPSGIFDTVNRLNLTNMKIPLPAKRGRGQGEG